MYTPSQERALERMLSGESIYLSGAAGVGKSYLLNDFIEKARDRGKNVMVTAPTGIAAINVGGSTVHSALGWPKLGKDVYASDTLIETDILVVDEISMCRLDLYDHIVKKLDDANAKRAKKGKREIQLICVGDFGQLPPVIKDDDRKVLNEFFPGASGYAFEHPKWTLPIVQLTEIVRQKDPDFAESLNLIRLGDVRGLDYINSHRSQKQIDGGIWVMATNKRVQSKNREELAKLKGKRTTYTAYTNGEYEEPTDKHLVLAEGCRVVSLVNQGGYLNGSLGTVLKCEESTVTVEFDNGVISDVGRHKWETKKPSIIEKEDGSKHLTEEVIGTFEQIPLKPAYAVTIHKSQGQTYTKMNADPYCFASGQLYVELSRAESIEGLYLTRKITEKDLKVDPKVVEFYRGSAPVTVSDIDFSTEVTTKKEPPIKSEPIKRKKRGTRKMDNEKNEKEVAYDTISTRASAETKAAFEKIMATMEGESKAIKFKNLIKAAGEANVLANKTGSDKEAYEVFVTHTTRLAECFNELLKQKSELSDTIRLDFQDQLESKDTTISDLQAKVADKEDKIREMSDQKKSLEEHIQSLEMVAKEVDSAHDKAIAAEAALVDSRMVNAKLQEDIVKLKNEAEGYDDLKEERDSLDKEKEKLSERLEERTAEITSLKEQVSDLESKLETEKSEREKERAEHVMELGRVNQDAVRDKDVAVQDARKDERIYWQDQLDKKQAKLDTEREKYEKERTELVEKRIELTELKPKVADLEEMVKKLQEELREKDALLKKATSKAENNEK